MRSNLIGEIVAFIYFLIFSEGGMGKGVLYRYKHCDCEECFHNVCTSYV